MIEQTVIDDLKAKHPGRKLRLLSAVADDGRLIEVVVKGPGRGEWKRFISLTADDRKKTEAAEQFLRSCIVYPDAPALEVLFADLPALSDRLASECIEFAGMIQSVEKKDL